MINEDNLHLATNDQLKELLGGLLKVHDAYIKLRENYCNINPGLKIMFDMFRDPETTTTEEFVQSIHASIERYTKDIEIIRTELEARNVD